MSDRVLAYERWANRACLSRRVRLAPTTCGLPGDLGDEETMAGVAGQDEEVIAEAVEVAKHEGFDEKSVCPVNGRRLVRRGGRRSG